MLLLLVIAVQLVMSFLGGYFLPQRRPGWSRAKVGLVAALPIPLILWGLSAYVVASVMMTSREDCGVDACGMAMAAAITGAGAVLVLYLIGFGLALLVGRSAPQSVDRPLTEDELNDVFS